MEREREREREREERKRKREREPESEHNTSPFLCHGLCERLDNVGHRIL